MLEAVEQRAHAGEHGGQPQRAGGVDLEEPDSSWLVAFVTGLETEGGADHAARAAAHQVAKPVVGQGRAAFLGQHIVDGAGQVGRTVDERAVQVEQHGGDAG